MRPAPPLVCVRNREQGDRCPGTTPGGNGADSSSGSSSRSASSRSSSDSVSCGRTERTGCPHPSSARSAFRPTRPARRRRRSCSRTNEAPTSVACSTSESRLRAVRACSEAHRMRGRSLAARTCSECEPPLRPRRVSRRPTRGRSSRPRTTRLRAAVASPALTRERASPAARRSRSTYRVTSTGWPRASRRRSPSPSRTRAPRRST